MPDSSSSSGFNTDFQYSDKMSEYQLISTTRHSRIYKTTYKGRILILKAANPESADPTASALLLRREYQILSELDNPFIVRTWGMRNDPQVGECLILDYVDGITLDRFLSTNPSHRTRLRIINELLDAIAYLHAKQIVHKDLKPSNILITTNGEHVKLIDFGFSDSDSQTANNLGCTNHYASPEQLYGRIPDFRSDIYTLGKIIREIEPHRYRIITHHCFRTDPSCRYHDVASLRKAIRRCNLLPIVTVIAGILAIVVLNIVPLFRSHSDESQQTAISTATDTLYIRETTVIKDTMFLHDTVKVVQADPSEPVIQELHVWYDKAHKQVLYRLNHLEYKYGQFAAIESYYFSENMQALKTYYQTIHPEFVKQIEQDYIAELSLRYKGIYKLCDTYPYYNAIDAPDMDAVYKIEYQRLDSIRSVLEDNPKRVFSILKQVKQQ